MLARTGAKAVCMCHTSPHSCCLAHLLHQEHQPAKGQQQHATAAAAAAGADSSKPVNYQELVRTVTARG
jgi:hypothetical protein